MVELPDNERAFVRVSFAVASSSPPLKATVPAPRAPPLPKASLPPASATLPIVFALLSDTNPESMVSAPTIVSEPAFSTSAASDALKVKEFARSALLTVTMYGPAADMVTASAKLGIVPVDQFVAMLQSPLVGFFQLMAVMFSLPIFCRLPVCTPESVD